MSTNYGNCFSFKGIVVGAMVAFGLVFLFNLLTVGGGLSAFTQTEKGLETLILLAYGWVIAGSFVIFFVSGMVATMVSHHCHSEVTAVGTPGGSVVPVVPVCDTAPRHTVALGFATWVLYLLISLAFLSKATDTSIVTLPQSFMSMSQSTANMTETTAKVTEKAVSTESASSKEISPSEQKAAHKLGVATLAAFFVFFVSALSCCFGAWCGGECCRHHRKCN